MPLVRQNGGLIKKSGALGRADNAFNVCCCGGCPICPDLCGYYIEAQAGGATYYPLKEGSDERVTSNDTFCAEQAYLYYPRPGRPQFVVVTETEGTPGLPSACGLGTSDVEYTGSGSTSSFLMTSTITARLAVGDGVEDEPRAQASLGLSCSNGVWTATVNWQVNRFVGGSLVQCSAQKIFPIRTGCQEDTTCEVPPGEGANIHSKVFTVNGDGVTVSGIGTIPFDEDDREGDCSGNACLSEWRSLWQARFQVYRVSCVPCSGPCDEENPCPEGCVCEDGQCIGDCTSKSCRLVAAGWPTFVPDGTCQGGNCCCEGLPQGGCFDESILDENGAPPYDANDWVLKAYCENCCENKLVFSVTHPTDGADRAQEWVENVRDHLLANGWGNATEHHVMCNTGNEPFPLSYVRVCCDGTLVCPATEEDCFAASLVALEPANINNLQPVLTPNCFFNTLECLPACEPNPLP